MILEKSHRCMFTIHVRSAETWWVVVSEPETKEYKIVFKKRRLMYNIDSLHLLIRTLFIYLLAISINSDILVTTLHFIV